MLNRVMKRNPLLLCHSQGHCNGKPPLSGPYIFRKSYYCSVPLLLACPRMCSPEQGQDSCFVIIILPENRHLTHIVLSVCWGSWYLFVFHGYK